MTELDRRGLLESLCLAPGPPGDESAVRQVVRDALDGVGVLSYDRLGSLVCEVSGADDGLRVVLDSHLDEVAFMVQSISTDGRVAFVALGGWWGHVLLGQRVDVLGADGIVHGVIGCKPPHFLSPDERKRVLEIDAMYVDVGVSSRDDVEALGVRIGDMVVPHSPFREMTAKGVVSAKALDNRIGVAVMIESLKSAAQDPSHPNTLIGVAAAQEEIGMRGAQTSSTLTDPDVALVLECTPADDLPRVGEPQGRMGGGPQLRFFDPTAVANRRLARWIADLAVSTGVPLQHAVRRGGGTNAGTIQRHGYGVPTAVIGVPARYIHSHVSLMQWSDYDAAVALIGHAVRGLDAATVAGFTSFSSD